MNTVSLKQQFENTPMDYLESCLKQRTDEAAGSYWNMSATELKERLINAEWIEFENESVKAPCKAFRTMNLAGGWYGMLPVEEYSDYLVIDPKETGFASLAIAGEPTEQKIETWCITGPDNGLDIVYTFHPGKPLPPSTIPTTDWKQGYIIRGREALKRGFRWAKIDNLNC